MRRNYNNPVISYNIMVNDRDSVPRVHQEYSSAFVFLWLEILLFLQIFHPRNYLLFPSFLKISSFELIFHPPWNFLNFSEIFPRGPCKGNRWLRRKLHRRETCWDESAQEWPKFRNHQDGHQGCNVRLENITVMLHGVIRIFCCSASSGVVRLSD